MYFLADQDVYQLTIDFLKELGHNVITVREIEMQRASDYEILQKAKQMNRVLITRDKDFGALVFLEHELSPGIIFLRITPSNVNEVHEEFKYILEKYTEDELQQYFCVVEAGRYRIRKIHRAM